MISLNTTTIIYVGTDNQPENEFQVTYQLINAGQCDTGDGTGNPPFDVKRTRWNTATAYEWHIQYQVIMNSTYWFSVQSRVWLPGIGATYGTQHPGINITSPLGKNYVKSVILIMTISKLRIVPHSNWFLVSYF